MILRLASTTFLVCFLALTGAFSKVQQTPEDNVVKATRNWLTNSASGDRAALNASMDERFIATTPGMYCRKRVLYPTIHHKPFSVFLPWSFKTRLCVCMEPRPF
jgi:hypothetical protein